MFNKETRRSLRERLISTVVQAPGNIVNTVTGSSSSSGDKRGPQATQQQHQQQKSHSVDSTSTTTTTLPNQHLVTTSSEPPPSEESISIIKEQQQQQTGPPISPSYLTAENNHPGGGGAGSGDGDPGGSRSGSVSSCSSSTSSSPSKYRTYVVKDNDTVTSIAAFSDCTPSELMRVNRLITARVLFPGQVLKIPNKRQPIAGSNQSQLPQGSSNTVTQKLSHQHAAGGISATSIVTQQPHDPATATILESITYAQRKFLKVKVRHVTDGNGVVSGTLLITPNAVMFDPNVSDPLVIEQGAETYGIIVPIEYIVGASIWSDICGMRVRGKEAFIPPGPRPVLWGEQQKENNNGGGDAKNTCNNSGNDKCEDNVESKEDSNNIEDGQQECEDKIKEDNDGEETIGKEQQQQEASPPPDGGGESENITATTPTSPNKKLEQVTEHPLKEVERTSSNEESACVVPTWYFCLTIGRPKPPSSGGGESGTGGGRSSHSRRAPFCVTYGQKNTVRPEFWFSIGKEQVPELYKYWMFWWPTIYGEVDFKAISDRGYEPVDWDNLGVLSTDTSGIIDASKTGAGGITATTTARTRSSNGGSGGEDGMEEQSMAQELNELTKESWEMLKQPYAKLSSFITTRGSSIMKSSSHSSQSSSVSDGMMGGGSSQHHTHHHSNNPQQQLHQTSHQSTSSSLFNSHHFSITNPMNSFFFESFSNISPNHSVFDDTDDDDDEFGSFEQVVTNEELRNLLAMGGEEMMAVNLPDLIGGKSDILEEEDMKNITRHLTARAEGYPWTLIFTSSRDGFSLNSLYRRNSLMQEDSPVMLIVEDTNSRVFGALVSCSLHTSDSFYGTGQSFLFTLRPEFSVYKWTGENLFFVKGNHDGIWIGAGDGKFGLYVDGDLNCGRTETCQTYGNPPLTEPQDFIIKTLECWAFGNYVIGGNDLIGGAGVNSGGGSVDTCK